MAAGHQDSSPQFGFSYPLGHHAALLWSNHPAAASHPRGVSAATSHEGDCVRGCRLPALLDAIPHRSDDRHIFQVKDSAVSVPGEDGGGPGHVCHPESGPAAQLRQPGAVRFRRGEVQEEAVPVFVEDGRHGENIGVEEQQVFAVVRNHFHIYVRTPKRHSESITSVYLLHELKCWHINE